MREGELVGRLTAEEIRFLQQKASAEHLTYLGHYAQQALRPAEVERMNWIADLCNKLERENWQQVSDDRRIDVGEQTMARVFRPAGLTNLSDMQAVMDAVEKALEEGRA